LGLGRARQRLCSRPWPRCLPGDDGLGRHELLAPAAAGQLSRGERHLLRSMECDCRCPQSCCRSRLPGPPSGAHDGAASRIRRPSARGAGRNANRFVAQGATRRAAHVCMVRAVCIGDSL
jgi:hypothetical protein